MTGKDGHEPFTSAILPRFLRRSPTLEGALATLYLKGVSTERLRHRPGGDPGRRAAGLSATTISRSKRVWETEYEAVAQEASGVHGVRLPVG